MAAPTFFTEDPERMLDDLLYEVCDDLQLPRPRHEQAQERYRALAGVLEETNSPFRLHRPLIYPQGSMRLGTTVRPLKGQHDLDFVLQLSRSHREINPMTLLLTLFNYLKQNGTYSRMVTLKNRCVRIEYANEFYMDILPACLNYEAGPNCIKVPDRDVQGWKDSNPIGYADWFARKSQVTTLRLKMMGKAMPVPTQQSAEDKYPLQLIVQLLKRWRDIYYATQEKIAPISIVLTTLAAKHYDGSSCINASLNAILNRISAEIDLADSRKTRLIITNPANGEEDLSERWAGDPIAYSAFKTGIRKLRTQWNSVLNKSVNVNIELERLFGETVQSALVKQAKRVQEARATKSLGVKPSGLIASASAVGAVTMRPNTYHGEE